MAPGAREQSNKQGLHNVDERINIRGDIETFEYRSMESPLGGELGELQLLDIGPGSQDVHTRLEYAAEIPSVVRQLSHPFDGADVRRHAVRPNLLRDCERRTDGSLKSGGGGGEGRSY